MLGVLLITLTISRPTSQAQDDGERCQGIVLVEGWMRPSVSATTAIYGKFINLSTEDDMLIGITSDISQNIEIHETSMVDDVMEMRPVEGGIHLPAQGMVSLEAGGLHGMVMGLANFVEQGQTITIEFEFRQAGHFEVEFRVGDPLEFEDEEPPQAIVLNGENCADTVGFYGAWSRPGIVGGTSAIYGILLNLSETNDVLVEVSSDIAETVELHESSIMDDGTMMMHPLEEGINISAGSYTILRPGGLHIMLINLADPLGEDGYFETELVFASAEVLNVLIPVKSLSQKNSMEHADSSMQDGHMN